MDVDDEEDIVEALPKKKKKKKIELIKKLIKYLMYHLHILFPLHEFQFLLLFNKNMFQKLQIMKKKKWYFDISKKGFQ
jgi:hypothetical protein